MNPTIRGVTVDVQKLRALAHTCDPLKCIGRERGCCETYEVFIDQREIGTIVGAMPHAARYRRALVKRGEPVDPFEDTDGGACLATNDHGRCVFAYRDKRGATLCSLHSAALDLGLPPAQVKPKACALWPLYLVEGDPALLTVQQDALEFPCNRRRPATARGLHPGVKDIVQAVFGPAFLTELEAALQ